MVESNHDLYGTAEVWRQDNHQLATGLLEREQTIRRLQAEQAAILAEMHSRGTLAEYGYGTLETLQIDLLLISRADARHRKNRALACHPTAGVGSTAIPALAPHTAQVAASGAIGPAHVDEIVHTLRRIPAEVSEEDRAAGEHSLVTLARHATPWQVRKAGLRLLAHLNPDGTAPHDDELARPRRELLYRWRRDGRLALTGELDTETGHALLTALSPLAKPQPANDGERDMRAIGQRNGDALAELINLALRAGELPIENGHRPQVMVTLDYHTLRHQAQQATQAGSSSSAASAPAVLADIPITAAQARRHACDADLIPAVLGTNSEILDLGRTQRLASPAQRKALTLRDNGCIKCRRPPQWCVAHHLISWIDGGPTDLNNLCLLCGECHRLIHHSEWTITMQPNGHPQCLPPPWMNSPLHTAA